MSKIILTGVSMGASTVLMAAGNELPENVVAVRRDGGGAGAAAEGTAPDLIIVFVVNHASHPILTMPAQGFTQCP